MIYEPASGTTRKASRAAAGRLGLGKALTLEARSEAQGPTGPVAAAAAADLDLRMEPPAWQCFLKLTHLRWERCTRPGAGWATRLGVFKLAKPGVLDALSLDPQGGFATMALGPTKTWTASISCGARPAHRSTPFSHHPPREPSAWNAAALLQTPPLSGSNSDLPELTNPLHSRPL